MNCKQVVDGTTDFIEGALRREQRSEWESHVAGCAHCGRYVSQMLMTIRLMGDLSDGESYDVVSRSRNS